MNFESSSRVQKPVFLNKILTQRFGGLFSLHTVHHLHNFIMAIAVSPTTFHQAMLSD